MTNPRQGVKLGLAAAAAMALAAGLISATQDKPMKTNDSPQSEPRNESSASAETELATFGAGCFWCTEAVFERLPGVVAVKSGYEGGDGADPTYRQVCTGKTGHAEVVQIEFDPERVSFEQLLDLFWRMHDPTTLNRQGADVGSQYRSVVFYHGEAQREAAEAMKRKLDASDTFDDSIVTEISPAQTFYEAEDYHQDYFDNNRNAPYCRIVIVPKLRKLDLKQ